MNFKLKVLIDLYTELDKVASLARNSIFVSHLQHLVCKTITMNDGNTSVAEADIIVLGRVVLAMEKE
ncbi:hypothetical protein [Moritella sp. JT01]|uniref:hypothetical protein n=1 Tax=Moritella sp. JT01 TaxID=756698 RepID=UPI0012F86E8B|nr:hypothetical protein [Moritella sp. JT01]